MKTSKSIISTISSITSSVLSLISMLFLIKFFRLSDISETRYKISEIILRIGDLSLVYSLSAYIYLHFRTTKQQITIGLSRDRWHTIYPRTVISIVVTVVVSFIFHNISLLLQGYGFVGLLIVILGYNLLFDLVTRLFN